MKSLLGSRVFDDDSLACLDGFDNLRELHLSPMGGDSKITDVGLERITKIGSLESLSLARAPITDRGLSFLPRLEALDRVTLNNCKLLTDEGIKNLQTMRRLKRVNLRSTNVTSEGAKALKAALPDVAIEPKELLK